jgi:hypothetical protein
MNKIFKITMRWLSCLIIIGGLIFTSCKNEDLNTDQFADKNVTIRAWGPNPLLRGDTIRFIGTKLNSVTEVIFPENLSVAPINVSDTELRAVAPLTAIDGYITLVHPRGEVTTKTQITYADSVVYIGIKSEHTPAIGGDTITITGDNFTSVTKVVFFDNVEVLASNFIEQTRYRIKLFLPDEAQTGEVYLLNGETSTYPTTLEISTPSITAVAPLTDLKAGRDSVIISGTLLNLAKEFVFTGGAKVTVENTNPDQIKVLIPAEAKNGIITLVAKSGLEYLSTDAITLLLPQNITHATETRYKVDEKVIISGDDLDLVTKVVFNGQGEEQEAKFTYDSKTKEITTTIPVEAQDGAIKLYTIAGEVVTPDVTLVKPVVTNKTASIVAGEEFNLEGTDLDLVAEVYVSGELCDFVLSDDGKIQVKTPLLDKIANPAAPITFTLTNGVKDFAAGTINVNRPEMNITTANPLEAKVGDLIVLEGVRLEEVTSISFDGAEATKWMYNDGKIFVEVPENAQTGLYGLTLNGVLDTDPVFSITGGGLTETIIWDGMLDITWNDGGRVVLKASDFAGIPAGSILTFHFQQKDAWGQAQINNGAWVEIPFAELDGTGTMTTNTYNDKSVNKQELILTREILDNIIANQAVGGDFDGAGIIIQGSDWIFTKATLTIKGGSSGEVIWNGEFVVGSGWGDWLTLEAALFANATVGKTMLVSVKDVAAGAQYGVRNSGWGSTDLVDYADITGGSFEFPITQGVLDAMSGGLYLGGHDYTITKIEIK